MGDLVRPGATVVSGTASVATRIVVRSAGLTVEALFASEKTWSPTSRSTGVLLM